MTSPQLLKSLLDRLGDPNRTVRHVVTGIVVGNRLFVGLRLGDHLVVAPSHLMNFIGSAEMSLAGHTVRLRPAERLSGEMIRDFFNGSLYDRGFAAMTPYRRAATLSGKTLAFDSFALDLIALGRQFGVELEGEDSHG